MFVIAVPFTSERKSINYANHRYRRIEGMFVVYPKGEIT